MFINGNVYIRRHLHAQYGGQQQGGISTPSGHNFIMLFTGDQGEQYGYQDGWNEDGVFMYTGEGQIDNMTFVRGNLAIRNHIEEGKDVHLFDYVSQGRVRYISQMMFSGYHYGKTPDREGNLRQIIIFELSPISAFDEVQIEPEIDESNFWQLSLDELRKRALQTQEDNREPTQRSQLARYRSAAIRAYVLKRAEGKCEGCDSPAPFINISGRPYLEPHHIRRLSDGGPDHPDWVAALCPNCHRRGHYSADKDTFNNKLAQIIKTKETIL